MDKLFFQKFLQPYTTGLKIKKQQRVALHN